MSSILARMARRSATFRPTSASDLLAVHVARRLSDPSGIPYYCDVCRTYPVRKIAGAVRAADWKPKSRTARDRVGDALEDTIVLDGGVTPIALGLKIERRVLGAAVFRGPRLIDTLIRHLPSAKEGAEGALMSALTWLTEQYPEASVGIETLDIPDSRRAELAELAKCKLREQGIALWELSVSEVLESYGLPDPPSRQTCRTTAKQLWPALSSSTSCDVVADAGLVGYAVQVRKCLAAVSDRKEQAS